MDRHTWFSYRSSIFFKLKLQESINNYNSTGPHEYILIPCYTCEDNQIKMIACRERRPLQDFHHIVLGIPSTRDDIRIRLALGQGFGLVLNEPILQEQALTGSRTTASTRGWKLEMCWSMPGFRFLE